MKHLHRLLATFVSQSLAILAIFRLPKQHEHNFLRLCHLIEPAREVWECECGQRKSVLKGMIAVETLLPIYPTSLENVLIDASTLKE